LFELFPYDYLAEGTLSASGIRGVIEKVTKSSLDSFQLFFQLLEAFSQFLMFNI